MLRLGSGVRCPNHELRRPLAKDLPPRAIVALSINVPWLV